MENTEVISKNISTASKHSWLVSKVTVTQGRITFDGKILFFVFANWFYIYIYIYNELGVAGEGGGTEVWELRLDALFVTLWWHSDDTFSSIFHQQKNLQCPQWGLNLGPSSDSPFHSFIWIRLPKLVNEWMKGILIKILSLIPLEGLRKHEFMVNSETTCWTHILDHLCPYSADTQFH